MDTLSVRWEFNPDENENMLMCLDDDDNVIHGYGVFTREDFPDHALISITPKFEDETPGINITPIHQGTQDECLDKLKELLDVFLGLECITTVDLPMNKLKLT